MRPLVVTLGTVVSALSWSEAFHQGGINGTGLKIGGPHSVSLLLLVVLGG